MKKPSISFHSFLFLLLFNFSLLAFSLSPVSAYTILEDLSVKGSVDLSGYNLTFGSEAFNLGRYISLNFNQGGSVIYDDTNLHIKTDDNLWLDAPGTTYVENDMALKGNTLTLAYDSNNPNFVNIGKTITLNFNQGESEIYDDTNLHLKTDDNMWLDVPGAVYLENDLTTLGTITAGRFVGPLTGDVTGNVSGTSGGLTGNPSISITNLTATGVITLPDDSITDSMIPDTITASNYLPLSGGTLSGDLNLGTNNITNINSLTATSLFGGLTGDVIGSLSGGSINTTGFTFNSGATAGYVLTTNASGVGSWTDLSSTGGPWTLDGTNIYPDDISYNVGIGTTSPSTKLHVAGDTLIQPLTNSITSFQINQADSTNVLTVDTTNKKLALGVVSDAVPGYLTVIPEDTVYAGEGYFAVNIHNESDSLDVMGGLMAKSIGTKATQTSIWGIDGLAAFTGTTAAYLYNSVQSLNLSGTVTNIYGFDASAYNYGSAGSLMIGVKALASGAASTSYGIYASSIGGTNGYAGMFVAGDATTKGIGIKGAASQTANLTEWQNSSGTMQAAMSPSGTLGLLGTAPTSSIGISLNSPSLALGTSVYSLDTSIGSTDNKDVYGFNNNVYANSTSGTTSQVKGFVGVARNNAAGTVTSLYGFDYGAWNASTGNVGSLYGAFFTAAKVNSGSVTTMHGVKIIAANVNSSGSVGTVYGLNLSGWSNSGTVNTSYGIFMDSSIDVGSTKYALYSASTSNSYFAGNVGIGTTNPQTKLSIYNNTDTYSMDIQGEGSTRIFSITNAWSGSYPGGSIRFKSSRGTIANPTVVSVNDRIGSIVFNSHDGTSYGGAGIIEMKAATSGFGGNMNFLTSPSGSSSCSTRMSIQNDGNIYLANIDSSLANATMFVGHTGSVGIGTTAPGAKLHINTGADATIGQIIRANSASQTANLTEWQNSSGTVLTAINSTGYVFRGSNRFIHNYGQYNTFVGELAGNFTLSGTYNTGLSYGTLSSLTSGSSNTALGTYALNSNTSGSENYAMGHFALYLNTTGNYNVAIGTYSLQNIITGQRNVAMGRYSLQAATGDNNTAIGNAAGYSNVGSANVFLGYQAGFSETGSNKLYIENSNSASPLIWGDFASDILTINGSVGIGTTAPEAKLDVQGSVGGSGDGGLTFVGTNVQTNYNAAGGGGNIYYGTYLRPTMTSGGGGGNIIYGLRVAPSVTDSGTVYSAIFEGGNVGIGTTLPTAKLDVEGGIKPAKVTADPCGSGYPEGTLFYNDTANYFCYCNGTNDVQMHNPAAACF